MFKRKNDNKQVNTDIEFKKQLHLLTQTFSEMLSLHELASLYNYIGTTLQQQYSNSVILISSIDEPNMKSQVIDIFGGNLINLPAIQKITGFNPTQKKYSLSSLNHKLYKTGEFKEYNGKLADFFPPEIPAIALHSIESLLGIHKAYTIGINKENQLLAAVLFLTLNKTSITDSDFIELFIQQAGIIIQKKITELALKNSETHFESLANMGQALIWTSGLDKKYNYFNKIWLSFTGRTLEQELGDGWADGVHPDDLHKYFDTYSDSFDARLEFSIDYRLKRYDGEYRWIQDNGTPMKNSEGEFLGYIGHCLDITERKKSEEELLRFRLGIERSDEVIYMTLPNGKISYANPAFEKVFGYKVNEVLGKTPGILKSGMMTDLWYKKFWDTLVSKNAVTGEVINKRKDGKLVTIEGSVNPILDSNGDILGFLAVQHDITERKLSDLQISNLSMAIEQSPVSIVITNIKGDIEYINPKFSQLTGYSCDETLGQNPRILKADGNDPSHYKNLWETIKLGKEWRGEFRNKKKNGEIYYESAVISPVIDENGIIINFVAVKEDITERKKTEHDILLSNERLESLLRITDYAASNLQDLLDFALEETIKLTESKIGYIYYYDESTQLFRLNSWSKDVHKQCTVTEINTVYELSKTGCWGEAVRQRKPIMINNYNLNHPLAKGIPEGHAPLEKFLSIPVIVDKKIVAVVGVANKTEDYNQSDVIQLTLMMDSVWKIVEKQKMIEELVPAKEKAVQSDNLKTAFLANMSHEIRTPMNAIMGFSELLTKTAVSETELKKYADIIHSRSTYLLTLIDDILDISKVEAGMLRVSNAPFLLNELMEDLATQYRMKLQKLNKNVEFKIHMEKTNTKSTINSDKNRIQQLLTNLIDNAIKFTSQGTITMSYKTDDENGVVFSVTDTGVGIASKDHHLIFERFSQSSDYVILNYGGLGLGLSICKGIVNILGGKIWVESELGKGAEFKFNIPVTFIKPAMVELPETIDTENALFQPGRILLVEDDLFSIELLQNTLEEFDLVVAENGYDAVELFEKHRNFGLILMDIGLPGISGLDVTKKIRETNSTVPIIALTAFVEEEDKKRCLNAGCNDFISKPVESAILLQKVKHYFS